MRKRGLAMLALAAVMAFGPAGITAMAAEGWVQEGGNWTYYNASGNKMQNVWRQGGDGLWRYIGNNGYMVTNTWVDDDTYYVDTNGIMVAGKWLQVTNTRSDDRDYDWYYFTGTGKSVKNKWEKIADKWYYFDDTGVMQTGWVLDDMYYCGTDGVMVTGWQKLEPADGIDDNDYSGPFEDEDDGKRWYYFGTNGKKVVPDSDGDNFKQKRINGVYYVLAEDGAMQTGWVCVTGDDSDNIEDYRYVDSNGTVRVGWYSIEPPENIMGGYDHDVEWFYFSNRGVPQTGPEKGAARSSDIKKINGNSYLFNEKGVPVYGLQQVYLSSDGSEYTAYYFGSRSQSSMLRGKQRIDEGGTTVQYYFTSTGRGYTGVYENNLYYMGKQQKADSGSKYEVISIPDGDGYKNYVVNTSGRIAKNTTVKDNDGIKYKTSSGGLLLAIDDETDGINGVFKSPEEPDWSAFD